MSPRQSDDWSPRKKSGIVKLRENVLSYAAIAREFDGNMTTSGVTKVLFTLSGNNMYTNQNRKRSKNVHNDC